MCPLSDEALLDWALARGQGDPEIGRHLSGCGPCRERSESVLREQEMLRGAFALPVPPAGLARALAPSPASRLRSRLAVAALLLLGAGLGLVIARAAALTSGPVQTRGGGRVRHAPLAPIQIELGVVAHRIAAARDTLPEAEDGRTSRAYLELLAQEEGLYIEGLEHYLSERSPLDTDQELDLRRTIQGFYVRLWSRENVDEASRGFREKMKSLLTEDQHLAFEEFSRQGMEWQWKTHIALLMDDLCGELDLRFSEAERVRRALESNYPKADPLVFRVDAPDPLVDDPAVSGAVRNSLDATYQRKFDSYLGHVRASRERALRVVRQQRSPSATK